MQKRTSPLDAARVIEASDLDHIVVDKREGWRATDAKARRRQRRYKQLLTRELVKQSRAGGIIDPDADLDSDDN
jgi:hypothetical protein